jgi:hypothetical protein
MFYKKRVDGEKEKQSNSARLQGKAEKTCTTIVFSIINVPR